MADTIAELRNMTGLTQVDFAKKYHIPLGTLRRWEISQNRTPEYVLYLLKIALGVEQTE